MAAFFTWYWEMIARAWAYDPDRVSAFATYFYARVETVCAYLSPAALAFYQALGYCLP